MTVHSPVIRTIAWMAIGRGRVAVVGHIVDGGQGEIRTAVWGWGCSSVMWKMLLLCWVAVGCSWGIDLFLATNAFCEFAVC